jgi:hypothetical protein
MKHLLYLGLLCGFMSLYAQDARPFYIGHSLVNHNMPAMVAGLATDAGKSAAYDVQICNGAPLRWNYQNYAGCEGTPYVNAFPAGGYNHLIVTEAVPLQGHLDWNNTYGYADSFYLYATQHNNQIPLRYFIYETWHCTNTGTPDGCAWDNGDSLAWQPRLLSDLHLWTGIVDSVRLKHPGKAICMVPVGQAFYQLAAAIDAGQLAGIMHYTDLFTDDIHLTNKGNYFVACVMYACIYGQSPVGLTTQLKDKYGVPFNAMPNVAQATVMQNIAWSTVQAMHNYTCVDIVSVTDAEQDSATDFVVAPNPLRAGQDAHLQIGSGFLGEKRVEVLSLQGQILHRYAIQDHHLIIHTAGLPDIFLIRVSDTSRSKSKLVVQAWP